MANSHSQLSRRERQIMDVLYERQECSAHEIQQHIPDPPSYSAVRALIARLVKKDFVKLRSESGKYIYSPKLEESTVRQSAIKRLIKTFFKGSRLEAVNALLDVHEEPLSVWEIESIERKLARAKQIKNKK